MSSEILLKVNGKDKIRKMKQFIDKAFTKYEDVLNSYGPEVFDGIKPQIQIFIGDNDGSDGTLEIRWNAGWGNIVIESIEYYKKQISGLKELLFNADTKICDLVLANRKLTAILQLAVERYKQTKLTYDHFYDTAIKDAKDITQDIHNTECKLRTDLGAAERNVIQTAQSIISKVKPDSTGVHRTHCCKKHGCKYGDEKCPVILGTIKQDHPCEDCKPITEQPFTFNELIAFGNWYGKEVWNSMGDCGKATIHEVEEWQKSIEKIHAESKIIPTKEANLLAMIEQCEQLAYNLGLIKAVHKINDAKNSIGWEMAEQKEAALAKDITPPQGGERKEPC